jgi:methionine synthase II (cobalamin-independent)
MFATVFGGLPRPPLEPDATAEALIEAAVRAQEDAGLEPIADAGFREGSPSVHGWEATARLTPLAVKQAVTGPYTEAWGAVWPGTGAGADAGRGARAEAAAIHANELNRLLRDLAATGCPMIEVHEPAAVQVGLDDGERRLFRELHLRLLDGVDTHVSLVVTGGNADAAGIDTLLAAPYRSLGLDLIDGPDNWRLVVATPATVGVVCGALSPSRDAADGPETLLWAAGYAASTNGRGPDRVGLATAASLAHLSWDEAVAKLELLGAAARLAVAPADERVKAMDPRAVSSRAAALGSVETRPSEPTDRPTGST